MPCADSDPLSVLELRLDNHLAKQVVMLGDHLAGMVDVLHSAATPHSMLCDQENALREIQHTIREKDSRSEMIIELQEQQLSEREAEQTAQMERTEVLMVEVDALTTELLEKQAEVQFLIARHNGIQHDAVQMEAENERLQTALHTQTAETHAALQHASEQTHLLEAATNRLEAQLATNTHMQERTASLLRMLKADQEEHDRLQGDHTVLAELATTQAHQLEACGQELAKKHATNARLQEEVRSLSCSPERSPDPQGNMHRALETLNALQIAQLEVCEKEIAQHIAEKAALRERLHESFNETPLHTTHHHHHVESSVRKALELDSLDEVLERCASRTLSPSAAPTLDTSVDRTLTPGAAGQVQILSPDHCEKIRLLKQINEVHMAQLEDAVREVGSLRAELHDRDERLNALSLEREELLNIIEDVAMSPREPPTDVEGEGEETVYGTPIRLDLSGAVPATTPPEPTTTQPSESKATPAEAPNQSKVLQAQLAEAAALNASLTEAAAAVEKDNTQLRSLVADLTRRAKEEDDTPGVDLAPLYAKLVAVNGEAEKLREENAVLKGRVEMRKEEEEVDICASTEVCDVGVQTADSTEATSTEDAEEELPEKKHDYASLQTSLTEATEQLRTALEESDDIAAQLSSLQKDYDVLQADHIKVQTDQNSVFNELLTTQNDLANSKTEHDKILSELSDLQTEHIDLQTKHNSLQTTQLTFESEYSNLTEKYKELKEELETPRPQTSPRNAMVNVLRVEHANVSRELQEAKRVNGQLMDKVEELKGRVQSGGRLRSLRRSRSREQEQGARRFPPHATLEAELERIAAKYAAAELLLRRAASIYEHCRANRSTLTQDSIAETFRSWHGAYCTHLGQMVRGGGQGDGGEGEGDGSGGSPDKTVEGEDQEEYGGASPEARVGGGSSRVGVDGGGGSRVRPSVSPSLSL